MGSRPGTDIPRSMWPARGRLNDAVTANAGLLWPTIADHSPVPSPLPGLELLGDVFAALVELSAILRTDDVFAPDFWADSAFNVRVALDQMQ